MKVETLQCDVCGAYNATHYRTLAHITNTSVKDFVGMCDVDLCDDCARKSTNLLDMSNMTKDVKLDECVNIETYRVRIREWIDKELHKYVHIRNLNMPKGITEDYFFTYNPQNIANRMLMDISKADK